MVTIRDVAIAVGVSVSTVSHALSGKRPISHATKKKIWEAIDRLGYEPNPAARALRTTTSGVIGFFAYDITEVFAARIIHGVEKVVREKGCYLLFTSGVEFNNDISSAIEFLNKRRVDGIIAAYGVRQTINSELRNIFDLPAITVNTFYNDSIPSIQPDDFKGGREAAFYLISKGVQRPAMIAGPENRIASIERLAGFASALNECGVEFSASKSVIHGDFTAESGARCLDILLEQHPHIDAVFCANDYMAAGAINRAFAHGLGIPSDLKVIGYDNREFSSFWPIPITTFALPLERMGEMSAAMLFDCIEGRNPDPMQVMLPSTLIIRQSS
ncbi:LacI family DNA-binding transcriptional regulator [Gracilinema caldarium]|uniref:Transcriptional regulator, LacI family n=1 Tax=Gracilinema caldarium (strain ATCC 51460 / DSM 7334 / H1) TaxID=744872 RepID=F8F1D4_GRAC1|nr:LacI family DNA-binding transcriptional regulator [Gracilinema caldarium]AEJ18778.1 transcriptional regulator, LacI family [Gracilinema caldarium DSM 7334]